MGVIDSAAWARTAAPKEHPTWGLNKDEGQAHVRRYQEALLQGTQAAAKKPRTWPGIHSHSTPGESPGDYYKRLCEAYQVYTPFSPEARYSQQTVNPSSMAQAAPDIRKKLQKLEGFAGMNITQLTEVADNFFMNREVTAEREAEKKMKKKVSFLSSSLREKDNAKTGRLPPPKGGKPRSPLAKDQCACCKEKGHWKNECPDRGKAPKPSLFLQEEDLIGLAEVGNRAHSSLALMSPQ